MNTLQKNNFFYEDFTIGSIFDHGAGRTVTQLDNELVAELTGYNHPLHSDINYANTTESGNVTLSGIATFSIVYGMSSKLLSVHAVANLEWSKVKFLNPVYLGDTLFAKSKILFKRESKSRPSQGIIQVKTDGVNQHNKLIISFERAFLIKRRYPMPKIIQPTHPCVGVQVEKDINSHSFPCDF